jgi:hypothetical protein
MTAQRVKAARDYISRASCQLADLEYRCCLTEVQVNLMAALELLDSYLDDTYYGSAQDQLVAEVDSEEVLKENRRKQLEIARMELEL